MPCIALAMIMELETKGPLLSAWSLDEEGDLLDHSHLRLTLTIPKFVLHNPVVGCRGPLAVGHYFTCSPEVS